MARLPPVPVKKVGSSAPVGLQQNTILQPASTNELYTMNRIMNGAKLLGASFNYWFKPSDPTNKDLYLTAWETARASWYRTTVQDGLARMMQNSDNRTTHRFQLRWTHLRTAGRGLARG